MNGAGARTRAPAGERIHLARAEAPSWVTRDALAGAIRHAEAAWPAESCGLIVAGRYTPATNIAADPRATFRIDPAAVATALRAGTLQAVVHSHPHPHPACPSEADMRGQLATGVPWGIVPVGAAGDAGVPFWWGDGAPRPSLIGRAYRHGVDDCYSVIRDWYRAIRGIYLPEVPRAWAWWTDRPGAGLYEEGFEAAGLVEIPRADAGVGDAVLIALGGRGTVSHAAVIVEEGVLLHHPGGDRPYDPGRLSVRDTLGRWLPHVRRVLRHRDAAP